MILLHCPLCDSPRIHQVEGTVTRTICGEPISIPSVMYWVCPDCGEKIFSPEAMRVMEDYIRRSKKQTAVTG